MRLDRQQFIHAAKFVKSAILVSEETSPACYVHVLVDGDKCVLTATDGQCGKRVILVRPPAPMDIETGQPADEHLEFMIPKPALEAFQTLCEKHNARLKDHIKRDMSLGHIDIGPNSLESYKDSIEYVQPPYHFPDTSRFFDMNKTAISEFCAVPDVMAKALKDFDKVHEITVSLSENIVHVQQFSGAYQAWFLVEEVD